MKIIDGDSFSDYFDIKRCYKYMPGRMHLVHVMDLWKIRINHIMVEAYFSAYSSKHNRWIHAQPEKDELSALGRRLVDLGAKRTPMETLLRKISI